MFFLVPLKFIYWLTQIVHKTVPDDTRLLQNKIAYCDVLHFLTFAD